MRLSERMIKKLKFALAQSFGDVPVFLFGSRANDSKVGGDIDLAIDVDLDQKTFREKKIKFKTALFKMGFDTVDVDVVPYHSKNELLAKEIQTGSVSLFSGHEGI